jgi:hypothetical protein
VETQLTLLGHMFGRADALNGYWNLYIGVTLGLLGVMASGKPFTELRTIKALLTVAFVAFALSNLDAIDSTNEQRRQLLLLLKDSPYYTAGKTAGPPESWQLRTFHLVLDLLIVLCVWLVPLHKATKVVNEG